MKTDRKKKNPTGTLLAIVLIVAAALFALQRGGDGDILSFFTDQAAGDKSMSHAREMVAAFAEEKGISVDAWPDELIRLLAGNRDARDFVLNYPLEKDLTHAVDLEEYVDSETVPLLFQWDRRWGYREYANELMGLSGCGPTCLSMVCLYLLRDAAYTPGYIAEFAERNGYCSPGNGSEWTLISVGGRELGLDVVEIPLDEARIIRNLEAGNPIICVMGPGDFTSTGHFIVMTGYADGKIQINDPNSPARSRMLWDYDAIKDQIRNLWVCR